MGPPDPAGPPKNGDPIRVNISYMYHVKLYGFYFIIYEQHNGHI